jgi:surface polysaccharide O-acyltransferase-like enzyme
MGERNTNIELMKNAMAYLVIALHFSSLYHAEGAIGFFSYLLSNGVARLAVPVFLILSGFYIAERATDRAYILKYCRRIFRVFLVWQIIYSPIFLSGFIHGGLGLKNLVFTLVWGYWHLWYLIATVGAVLLLYLLRRRSSAFKITLSLILLAAGYALQLLMHIGAFDNLPLALDAYLGMGTTRNFLFMAYPLVQLGNSLVLRAKKKPLWPLSIPLLSVALLVESSIYWLYLDKPMDFIVSSIPLALAIVRVVAECPRQIGLKLPAGLSLGIYLCHPGLIGIIDRFGIQRSANAILLYIGVCVVATAAAFAVQRINRKIPLFL